MEKKNEIIPLPLEDNFDIEKVVPEPKEEIIRHKSGKTSTNAEYTQRIDEAIELILYKNYTYGQFLKIYPKMYDVSEPTAKQVWKKVKSILLERSLLKQDEIIANQIARYMDLLQRARDDGNKRVERETLWDIARIQGLDQRKVDITSGGEPLDIRINLSNNPKDFGIGN